VDLPSFDKGEEEKVHWTFSFSRLTLMRRGEKKIFSLMNPGEVRRTFLLPTYSLEGRYEWLKGAGKVEL
jgi:hypothetical protein